MMEVTVRGFGSPPVFRVALQIHETLVVGRIVQKKRAASEH